MKTGLVLEGGAMRGIYTAGVLDAFEIYERSPVYEFPITSEDG